MKRKHGTTMAVMISAALASGVIWAQDKVIVGGAESLVPITQTLAQAYMATNAAHGIEIQAGSLGSSGAIKATEAGRIGIGLTGRPLKDSEKASLVYRQLAVMPVVVAVNGGLQVTGLSTAQLCAIYSGSIKSWKQAGGPDTNVVPLTRNEDDSDKTALRAHVGCYGSLKESPDVIVLTKGSEMASALASRPGTIGLTSYDAVLKSQGRIKAIAIDGVAPSPETVRAGNYKLVKDYAVVTRGNPQGAAKGFLDYVAGPEGEKIMAKAGVVQRK